MLNRLCVKADVVTLQVRRDVCNAYEMPFTVILSRSLRIATEKDHYDLSRRKFFSK